MKRKGRGYRSAAWKYGLWFLGLLLLAICLSPAFPQRETGRVGYESGKKRGYAQRLEIRGGETASPVPFLEFPAIADSSYFLYSDAGRYGLLYNPVAKGPHWVAYRLTRTEVLFKGTERKNRFRPDPKVLEKKWPSATLKDYYHSSYDRGHLLPSADRDDTPEENEATFLLSNIAPQRAELNRRTWLYLEEKVRDWAYVYGTLWIVCGPLFDDERPRCIGSGGVRVPSHFFKVVLTVVDGKYQGIGFIIPNTTEVGDDYMRYAVSIDDVERRTGFDFYAKLPPRDEVHAERRYRRSVWR